MLVRAIITVPALLLPLAILTPALGEQTAQQMVQDANRLLAEGSYSEAAKAYGDAIELEPTYSNYYKRATAYLSMGRTASALDDFDTILKVNPSLVQAHYQRAKIYAKQGDFEEAESELKAYRQGRSDTEADELSQAVGAASSASTSARQGAKDKQWQTCMDHATRALEVAPNSVDLRQTRVECGTEIGSLEIVYADLSRLAALNPSSVPLSLKLSHISYFLLASSNAMNHIKQCLHYDPDSKTCRKAHKSLRSLNKDIAKARNFAEGGAWRQAIKVLEGEDGLLNRFEKVLSDASVPQDGVIYISAQFQPRQTSQKRLELYALACKAALGANDLRKDYGMKWCQEAFEMDEKNVDALIGRGEKLLREEKWDDAVRVFETAFQQTGQSNQDILNRLQKAQRLLKVSKQKDYYKVLGVSRDADTRTIKKAFRKAAKTAHPDVGGSEAKMAALNEAYEVLSTDELKQRYDNGDDPNDPAGGRQGNPFAHHGGGMPFQFFQQGGGFQGFQGFQGGGHGQKMHFQWG